jgi:hypothetical protein
VYLSFVSDLSCNIFNLSRVSYSNCCFPAPDVDIYDFDCGVSDFGCDVSEICFCASGVGFVGSDICSGDSDSG